MRLTKNHCEKFSFRFHIFGCQLFSHIHCYCSCTMPLVLLQLQKNILYASILLVCHSNWLGNHICFNLGMFDLSYHCIELVSGQFECILYMQDPCAVFGYAASCCLFSLRTIESLSL